MADEEKVKRFSWRYLCDKAEKPVKVSPAYKFSKGNTKYQQSTVNRK